jgi:hypothetical protein
MASMNFQEDKNYKVHRLHYLDIDGERATVQDASVRFTAGWVCVSEEDADAYVIPRERVVQAEGVTLPTGSGRMIAL